MEIVIIAHTKPKIRNMSIESSPFEGFFVSSIEFCKIKIDKDDRKVNRTGTQCPPGLA